MAIAKDRWTEDECCKHAAKGAAASNDARLTEAARRETPAGSAFEPAPGGE